jgi:hypothetical protein
MIREIIRMKEMGFSLEISASIGKSELQFQNTSLLLKLPI